MMMRDMTADLLLLRCKEMLEIEPGIRQFAIGPDAEAVLHSCSWADIVFMPGTEPPRRIHGRPYVVAALPPGVIRGTA